MMEPITTPMMHISESKTICSSLSCTTSENDEIAKKLEDELLYGVEDDADEEDALSDDSLRLRLSDDEIDGDDNNTAISCPMNDQLKSVKTEPQADWCTSKTGENSNETKNEKSESNSNNINFTEINFKLSDVNTESDSSNQEPKTIIENSCESKVQDPIKTITDNNTENVLQNPNDSDENTSKIPISITSNDSLNLQENDSEKLEEHLTPVQKVADDVSNDSNESNIKEDTSILNDDDRMKLPQNTEIENDPPVPTSTTSLEDDNQKSKNKDDEKQKEDSVVKKTSDSNIIDNIPIKQEIPSPKLDSIEKTNNKRRLSESDGDEVRMHNKVLCQEFAENSPKPLTMQENVTVKICQGPDGVSELEKIMESEGKSISDENSLKNNFLNNDSCSIDMENTTFSLKTSVEDENDKNDEHVEKEGEIDKSHGESIKGKRRRKRRKTISPNMINQFPIHLQIQEKENVRQKRETAQKAQEMIRKLNNDSDSDSDERTSKISYKSRNSHSQSLSSPTLKRNLFENEEGFDGTSKKPKNNVGAKYADTIEAVASENKQTLEHVRKFFLRDAKQKLAKLTQEQLEEILIQKVIETITMRDEIGRLREQARISERNQEATRLKCQQLAKQIKDFEMVLTRFAADRRSNEKTATPIKINRSVGLQVSFVTENGIQNLRQLNNMKSNSLPNGVNTLVKPNDELATRKGIKVRSPRRPEIPVSTPVTSISTVPASVTVNSSLSAGSLSSRGLVITKAVDPRQPVLTTIAPSVVNQQLPNQALTLNVHGVSIHRNNPNHQTKVLNVHSNDNNSSSSDNTSNSNSNISTSINNSGVNSNINTSTTNNNSANLIDLTEEEEKNKDPPPLSTISVQAKDHPTVSNATPRYPRIVQPAPANVTLSQSAIKVIQPTDKPTPTALVNNMSASPRLTLVMKGGTGQPQLFIANTNQIRPVVSTAPRPPFSGITYSGVVSGQTISNGTTQVRVVPASNVTAAQKLKHPAALPAPQKYPMIPSLKLPPPAPSLKISKAPNGIVLSWNMALSDKYAEIASYQLYAYQEVTGMVPRSTLWRKVGDVRALALPMACTLTQFTEGNTYYFAVRAVDTHSRVGSYSRPGSIFL
ncbi:activating transcription factor 7-interacting protein 1-like isoform X2 [Chelonus insularis]|uniref:activating transcription factor 7-interacting protein 1-like isoform X2 n=1 Tax=Chelonus insularis TaxID=460826 RepID=UPI00158AAD41|nr:activating transcription factor 7-interacting protein 1-like isoform X2 [Chelonus insularis]